MAQLHPGPHPAHSTQSQSWSWPRRAWHRASRPADTLDTQKWGFWGAVAAIMVLCALHTSTDYSSAPRERRTTTLLQAWSSAAQPLQLHSSIGDVNLETGLLTLDMTLIQKQQAGKDWCSQPAAGPLLLVGSTAAPTAQVVLPLCELPAEHSFSAVLPLQQQPSQPQPFDRHTAEVRVALAPAPAAEQQQPEDERPAGGAALPAVAWSAMWAAHSLQVSVQHQSRSATARLLAAAAAAGGYGGDDGGWGSSLQDALVLRAAAAADSGSEATYQVVLIRCWWLRVLHLTAAAVQVLAVAGCCLLLLGQCVASYLMQRLLLCSRVHGTAA